jgi:protoporphyrinogen oxidase
VGGGLAGLCCARRLERAGADWRLVEAAPELGGRVATDVLDGFRLDRGFQVLLTAYPEARAELDYGKLDLRAFYPGALVRFCGRFHRLADPLRRPADGLASLFGGVGTLADKARIGRLQLQGRRTPVDRLLSGSDRPTLEALRNEGLSEEIISAFFRPFLGGIFLDPELETSARMFRFVFSLFGRGDTALPARGMGEIPRQLAEGLPAERIRLGARAAAVDAGSVRLEDGTVLEADGIVVATDGRTAADLGLPVPAPDFRPVTCLYYAADRAPFDGPMLVLDGDGTGPINNLCVPSNVSREYAPDGRALVSVSVLADDADEDAVRSQLREWYGKPARAWSLLRIYRIARALPAQPRGWLEPPRRPVRLDETRWVAGDHRDDASIQGAMVSGRRAAEDLLGLPPTV